jgi:DNA-binding transcriptional LysR family regulator
MNMSDPAVPNFRPGEAFDSGDVLACAELPQSRLRNLRISLRQWKMFHAVIDSGGFVGAANTLHVSQSSISHALNKLQEQLGVPLLALKGRKARLTEEGAVLLARSRELVKHAVELEELAENLRLGGGREIRLAVDPDFPPDHLMMALRELSALPCKTRVSVQESSVAQTTQALHDKAVDLAISPKMIPGFTCSELIKIEHVVVAHPDNPLFALRRALSADDLKTQMEIAVSGISDYRTGDASHRPRPWTVSTLEWAIGALRHGLGYAWLPKHRVQRWLDAHQVRILPLKAGASYTTRLYLVHGWLGPADARAATLVAALHSCTARPL